jgi:uncharacterized membrane protein
VRGGIGAPGGQPAGRGWFGLLGCAALAKLDSRPLALRNLSPGNRSALRSESDAARVQVLTVASAALRAERWAAAVFGQPAADAATAWLERLRDGSPISAAAALRHAQAAAGSAGAAPTSPVAGRGAPGGGAQPGGPAGQRAARPRPRLELSVDRAGSGGGGGGDADDEWQGTVIADLLRALGAEKVAADDVLLTVMLGALAAVMWARQRQMQGGGAARGGNAQARSRAQQPQPQPQPPAQQAPQPPAQQAPQPPQGGGGEGAGPQPGAAEQQQPEQDGQPASPANSTGGVGEQPQQEAEPEEQQPHARAADSPEGLRRRAAARAQRFED